MLQEYFEVCGLAEHHIHSLFFSQTCFMLPHATTYRKRRNYSFSNRVKTNVCLVCSQLFRSRKHHHIIFTCKKISKKMEDKKIQFFMPFHQMLLVACVCFKLKTSDCSWKNCLQPPWGVFSKREVSRDIFFQISYQNQSYLIYFVTAML